MLFAEFVAHLQANHAKEQAEAEEHVKALQEAVDKANTPPIPDITPILKPKGKSEKKDGFQLQAAMGLTGQDSLYNNMLVC